VVLIVGSSMRRCKEYRCSLLIHVGSENLMYKIVYEFHLLIEI
jgi:hypothetical protein